MGKFTRTLADGTQVEIEDVDMSKSVGGVLLSESELKEREPAEETPADAAAAEELYDMLTATEYSWSTNRERFHGRFSSKEDAACEGIAEEGLEVGDTVYVGVVQPHTKRELITAAIDPDMLFQFIGEYASDLVGDVAESWPETPSEEKMIAVHEGIVEVLSAHVEEPGFWSIREVEQIEVTQELWDKVEGE